LTRLQPQFTSRHEQRISPDKNPVDESFASLFCHGDIESAAFDRAGRGDDFSANSERVLWLVIQRLVCFTTKFATMMVSACDCIGGRNHHGCAVGSCAQGSTRTMERRKTLLVDGNHFCGTRRVYIFRVAADSSIHTAESIHRQMVIKVRASDKVCNAGKHVILLAENQLSFRRQ
jgi:hypothetical protein